LSTYDKVCLEWLAEALQQAREEGRTKIQNYLVAVLEDVVFETEHLLMHDLSRERDRDGA
jgi:hypothetical protein